jgi:UDP-glucuronate 4-epimerase
MHIMLTGHRGYIGTELLKRLTKNNSVVGFDLIDGQDLAKVKLKEQFDLIIHLAGKSGVRDSFTNPHDYWFNNLEVFKRILDVYGNTTRILYASSSSAAEPELNPYAASKFLMEIAASKYPNTLGMRFHTVYSSKPRKGMFMQKLIDRELEYTTNHLRDFIHLEDLCDAIELLITSNLTDVVDIGTGNSVAIADLAPSYPVKIVTHGERQETRANTKIMESLGFTPKYEIQKFLKILS